MNFAPILQGALGLVSLLYPPAAPFVAIIERAAPYIEAAVPIVQTAIKEGPGAFAAVKEAAPQLTQAIESIASHVFSKGLSFGSSQEATKENLARAIFGFRQMTFEEEMRWMNSMTPHNDPSQENSKFGG